MTEAESLAEEQRLDAKDAAEARRDAAISRLYDKKRDDFVRWLAQCSDEIADDLQAALKACNEAPQWNNTGWTFNALHFLQKIRAKAEKDATALRDEERGGS